jgi:hypothetical protein
LFLSLARTRQLAPLVLVLLSATCAVAAYLQAIDYPFIFDDFPYIVNNTELARLHPSELWQLFTKPYNVYFEFLPLRDFSYWFEMTLFGLNPAAFRLHNILLYLLCVPLVYATTLELWRYFRLADAATAPWAAAIVAALFALHPAHVEAVVWISGRKDALSVLFSLLALWLAMKARREQSLSAPHAAGALVAIVAAMLSKETAIAVAPVIAMLWLIFWRYIPAPKRRPSMLLWPLASLLLAVCINLIFLAYSAIKAPPYFGIEAAARSLAILGWLARLSIGLESRHFYYPVLEDTNLPAMITLGAFVLQVTVVGIVMMLRKRTLEGLALVIFILLCLPYTQVIPFKTISLVADRYLTLAVWPAILLIVALCWRLRPVFRIAMLGVLALSWGFQTVERPRNWLSFDTLVETDVRAYPGFYQPVLAKIGGVLLPQGLYREANEVANHITTSEFRNLIIRLIRAHHAVHIDAIATGDPQEAAALLMEIGLAMTPPPVQIKWNTPVNLGWSYCRDLLLLQWKDLVSHFPDDLLVRYAAGNSLLSVYRYEDATEYLRTVSVSQHLPELVRGQTFKNLGLALMGSGRVVEAETPLRAALEQSPPDLQAYCLLAKVYKHTGRIEEARSEEHTSELQSHHDKS